jgi:hypothetical protein
MLEGLVLEYIQLTSLLMWELVVVLVANTQMMVKKWNIS